MIVHILVNSTEILVNDHTHISKQYRILSVIIHILVNSTEILVSDHTHIRKTVPKSWSMIIHILVNSTEILVNDHIHISKQYRNSVSDHTHIFVWIGMLGVNLRTSVKNRISRNCVLQQELCSSAGTVFFSRNCVLQHELCSSAWMQNE